MAFDFQKHYAPDIEQLLRQYYQSLSEKDRRRFAAVEALTLGHGGTTDIANILGGDPHTIQEGIRELKQLPDDPAGKRVRQPGGGRKKTEAKHPALLQHVQDTIKERIAGDPMRDDVLWTDVTPQEMTDRLHTHGVCAGPRIVRRLLDTLGLARRQIAKVLPGGDSPQRAAQFRHLGHLIQEFLAAGNPVLSIDTKKKEFLGTLYRHGKVSCQQALQAFDHDVPSLARGVIIPHGIDDLAQNHGWIHGGLSRDTTAFACEAYGCFGTAMDGVCTPTRPPSCSGAMVVAGTVATSICSRKTSKAVVNDLAVPIRVAHYPAYCSKCNPIERRLFSHVTRACQGVLFDSLQTVLGLIQKTKTQQGLSVTVRVLDKLYEGGRTVSEAFKKHMPIVFDSVLPKWNYWAVPQCV